MKLRPPSRASANRAGTTLRRSLVPAVAFLAFLGVLALVEAGWAPLRALNDSVALSAHATGRAVGWEWWTPVWQAVSLAGAPTVFRVLAAAALLIVWVAPSPRLRSARGAVTGAALAVLAGGLLPVAIKALVGRPRPEAALVAAAQSSFPSAHAFGITVAALCAIGLARRGQPRVMTSIAAGVLVLVVCGARVCLAVHYLSDVVAGAALGVVWVGVASVAGHAVLSAGAGGRAR
ncbi:phosphatase PAP2 family protein [Microbacterium flavum]|uniref:Phosphatase PAP2 family protein n=1 Tax=Microbacterium flavum TaxID=415216 RepID=A0ABS5XSF6_9MICO|nr:phosphatase PAP2 family protein [Microbacterium flavum]MBT8797447.1 phosphatase PAP2 family protein [Microbacterium flavum]